MYVIIDPTNQRIGLDSTVVVARFLKEVIAWSWFVGTPLKEIVKDNQ